MKWLKEIWNRMCYGKEATFGPASYERLIVFKTKGPKIEIHTGQFTSEAHIDKVLSDFAIALKTVIKMQRRDLEFKTTKRGRKNG